MKTNIKIILRLLAGLVILIVALIVGWGIMAHKVMSTPYVQQTTAPLSYPEFCSSFGVTNFPPSASNIYYASSRLAMGFAGARLYRFDAPVSDCLAYAQGLAAMTPPAMTNSSLNDLTDKLMPLSEKREPVPLHFLEHYGLGGINWFNIDDIEKGVEGNAPPNARGNIWVDTTRGRCYYYWTD